MELLCAPFGFTVAWGCRYGCVPTASLGPYTDKRMGDPGHMRAPERAGEWAQGVGNTSKINRPYMLRGWALGTHTGRSRSPCAGHDVVQARGKQKQEATGARGASDGCGADSNSQPAEEKERAQISPTVGCLSFLSLSRKILAQRRTGKHPAATQAAPS